MNGYFTRRRMLNGGGEAETDQHSDKPENKTLLIVTPRQWWQGEHGRQGADRQTERKSLDKAEKGERRYTDDEDEEEEE
jgi:hypothetical protein